MSIYTWKLHLKPGSFELERLDLPGAASLDEVSARLPGGAYTTLRTYRRSQALGLPAHLQRLQDTTRLAGHAWQLDAPLLRAALRRALESLSAAGDLRLRLTVDFENQPGQVYLTAQDLQALPDALYQQGARVVTCDLQRWLPQAKLTRFIARAGQVRAGLPAEVNEAIMVDPQGRLMEGLSSNFFAVKDGVLWTAGEGVLGGVTRSIVMGNVQRLGLPINLQPVRRAQIPELEEAFITSSSRAVLPLAHIDQVVIASGQPGTLTRRLMAAYQAYLDEHLEPV
ncbi:MAG: aminotransferase class IV [Chloroflexota bacterium]